MNDDLLYNFSELETEFFRLYHTRKAVLSYIHIEKNGDAAKAWTIQLVKQTNITLGLLMLTASVINEK